MTELELTLLVIELALQLLVAAVLARGSYRLFPAVAMYVGSLAATTAGAIGVYLYTGEPASLHIAYSWTSQLLRQWIAFGLIFSFAFEAISERWRIATCAIVSGAAILWTLSLGLYQVPVFTAWLSDAVGNLSFCTAIATLAVWFLLASRRPLEATRLVVAGGLGLQLAGEAVGYALRQIQAAGPVSAVGAAVILATQLLCLILWWQTFSRLNPAVEPGHRFDRAYWQG